MGELFGVDRSVITKHIGNIFSEGELDEKSNVQKMHFANSDNEYKILHGKGKITKAAADKKAKAEYDKFNKTQKIESDFDKLTKKLQNKK